MALPIKVSLVSVEEERGGSGEVKVRQGRGSILSVFCYPAFNVRGGGDVFLTGCKKKL